MATVTVIPEKTQSKTAMSKVMKYISQDKKTLYENDGQKYKLLSGQNCVGETAFQEFMATKKQYAKEKGVYFYQYVQSFKPDVKASPREIHRMGLELAKYFEGYEVQIATHIDRDHYHNHLIVNSVSCSNGKKLQFNEKNLMELRDLSDEICQSYGLEMLIPYTKNKIRGAKAGEFRAAQRGESWKFRLMNAIDQVMLQSRTKAEFISGMKRLGYKVKWEPHHKYITYTTPQGLKCRDNRLHEPKYLKTEMEEYFNAGLRQAQGTERHTTGTTEALSAGKHGGSQGAMGQHGALSDRSRQGTDRSLPEDRISAYLGEHGRGNQQASWQDFNGDEGFGKYDGQPSDCGITDADEENEYGYYFTDEQNIGANGAKATGQRLISHQAEAQNDGNGSAVVGDILHLAKAIEDMVNPYNPEEESEKLKEYRAKAERKRQRRKRQRRKRQNHSYDEHHLSM